MWRSDGGALDAPGDLLLGHAPHFQREGHVLAHGHVRIERIVLEDHGDVAPGGRHVVDQLVADQQLAAIDGLEARENPQQRRLPAAGRADEDHEFVVRDFEVELGDDGEVAVLLHQAAHRDRGHQRVSSKARTGLMDLPSAKWAKRSGRASRPKRSSTSRA